MTIEIQQEDGLNVIHIDDYKKFYSTIDEIRASVKTRILLYFVIKPDGPDYWSIPHDLGTLSLVSNTDITNLPRCSPRRHCGSTEKSRQSHSRDSLYPRYG